MYTYLVALIPILMFFSDPITQFFCSSQSPPQIRRLPRPRLNEELLALEPIPGSARNYTCPPDAYTVHIFSRAPLVLYIENFLSPEERKHLLEISEPLYAPSTITNDAGQTTARAPAVRDSEVALVPRTGAVRCIEDRARALQGWRPEVWVERLRVQRYRAGGHYAHHFDWSSGRGGWGRVSSFMVWVDGGGEGGGGDGDGDLSPSRKTEERAARDGEGERLEGGGTEFPLLRAPEDDRWCRFVECDDGGDEGQEETGDAEREKKDVGVVFKPAPGNAVYWENFMADGTGRGYEETWHAGLPVRKGVKIGLNIWSWGRI